MSNSRHSDAPAANVRSGAGSRAWTALRLPACLPGARCPRRAVDGGRGAGGGGQSQDPAGADQPGVGEKQELSENRQHPGSRRLGGNAIHDQRHRIRGLPVAAHGRGRLSAERHEAAPSGVCDLLERDSRNPRSAKVPEEIDRQPEGRSGGRRELWQHTSPGESKCAGILHLRRGIGVLHRRNLADSD